MVVVVVVGHGLAWENGRKSAVLSSISVCKSARLFHVCGIGQTLAFPCLCNSHHYVFLFVFLFFSSFYSTFSLFPICTQVYDRPDEGKSGPVLVLIVDGIPHVLKLSSMLNPKMACL